MRGWNYGPYWLIATLLILVAYAFIAAWLYERRKARTQKVKLYDQEQDTERVRVGSHQIPVRVHIRGYQPVSRQRLAEMEEWRRERDREDREVIQPALREMLREMEDRQ